MLSSLASRLARLEQRLADDGPRRSLQAAGGETLKQIAAASWRRSTPTSRLEAARGKPPAPTSRRQNQVARGRDQAVREAAAARSPPTRSCATQLIDDQAALRADDRRVSQDELISRARPAASEQARSMVQSFEQFIARAQGRDHRAPVPLQPPVPPAAALRRHQGAGRRHQAPAALLDAGALWQAYETLDQSKVRGVGHSASSPTSSRWSASRCTRRRAGALSRSEVEHALRGWLAQQANRGRRFTAEQRQWLELIRDHVAASLAIETDDFDYDALRAAGRAGQGVSGVRGRSWSRS